MLSRSPGVSTIPASSSMAAARLARLALDHDVILGCARATVSPNMSQEGAT